MFARLIRLALLGFFAITLTGRLCVAQTVPTVPVARTVQYSDTDIIPVRAEIRFSTLIVLPRDEEILDATTGDKDFWIISGAHNLCYLHPAKKDIRSNLNLITASGHVYSFLLTEISDQPKAQPDLKIFVERRDDPTANGDAVLPELASAAELDAYKNAADSARREAQQQVDAAQKAARREISQYRAQYPGRLSFDYRYSSKASEAPFDVSAIFHDDKFTYIRSSAQEKPTLYELKDGKPSIVNFDLSNGLYVIPKIVDDGYLAVGKKKLQFVRRSGKS